MLPGDLDLELVQSWLSELLQERGADMYRMKGVLSVAHAKQRFVYHAVHLPIAPHISPYLPISPHISPYLQVALPGDASPLPPHPCPYQAARNADFEWFDLYSAEAAEPRAPLQDWPEFKRLQAGDIGEI